MSLLCNLNKHFTEIFLRMRTQLNYFYVALSIYKEKKTHQNKKKTQGITIWEKKPNPNQKTFTRLKSTNLVIYQSKFTVIFKVK